jgi:hypothetical protein
MVPAGGSADVAAETLVKLVNNRKKNKRRARGDPGACSDHVESPSSSCHLRLSWLCVQIRAGRRIADMKNPGAVSRIASRVYPTCARKKPISGRPEIGAHFVSFNFPNNVIWG